MALVKILEPVSPMLNYFEYEILNRGGECAIGIGVGALNYPQVNQLLNYELGRTCIQY